MTLAVCALNSGVSPLLLPNVVSISSGRIASHSQRRISSKPLPNIKLSSPPLPNIKLLGIASKPFQSSPFHAIPILSNRPLLPSLRASINEPHDSMTREPVIEPRFWLRILACIPYLMSFQEIWFFAETARYVHPLVQDFKFCSCPLLISLGRIPRWFFFAYYCITIFGPVNRKEWPHFFRFHVGMSLLLEMLFLIAGTLTRIYGTLPQFYRNLSQYLSEEGTLTRIQYLSQSISEGSLTQYLSQSISEGSLTQYLSQSISEGSLAQYLTQYLSQPLSQSLKSPELYWDKIGMHFTSPELYFRKIGMHFWVFISFAFVLLVLECMRCALCGKRPDVPFLSAMVEAA